MPDPRRLLVIYNPAAGRPRNTFAAAAISAMRAEGADVTVRETVARGDAERLARTADAGFDAIVAAGGDGTVNEVINGLSVRGRDAAAPALGIIPLGTVNVLARELELPGDAVGLARFLVHGSAVPLYTGIANGRRFGLMAGVGFDARVVRRLDPRLKRIIGRGAYALAILRELIAYESVRYRVTIDGHEPIEAASAVIAKGRFYGGPFELAAGASVRKPDLHVCLFLKGGRRNALRYLAALAMGRIAQADGFRVTTGSRITISGPVGDPVQGDGDTLTALPLQVQLADTPLSVIAPQP